MTSFASVAGAPIVEGSLLVPSVGVWTADVYLASSNAIAGQVTVQIGNLSLVGTVYRCQVYGGQARARLVGGAGGWRSEVQPQGYGSPSGVRLSTVLGDLARACGETVNVASDTSIGYGFARCNQVASDVLWQMVAQGIVPAWRVDVTGITQLTAWPATTIQTPFVVTDHRPDEGIVTVATEDYASWLPGCSFTDPTLNGATYMNMASHYIWTSDGKFRFEVMVGADNIVGSFDAIVAKSVAPTRFHGRYGYTISNPTTTSVDAEPKNSTLGLPSLQNVPLRSDSIATYTPPDGGDCDIMFLDGVPTAPICVWTAGAPTMAQLLGGSNPVARQGDQVQVFLPPTLPLSGTVGGSPFTGVATITNPISGSITQGSPTVSTA